jgi:hypothetical protein
MAGQRKIFETRRSLLQTKSALYRQRIAEVNEEIGGYTVYTTPWGTIRAKTPPSAKCKCTASDIDVKVLSVMALEI